MSRLHRLSSLLAAVLALVAVAAPSNAVAAAPTRLAPAPDAAGLTAFGGHVVWSARDPETGLWSLQRWHAGVVERLPVAARSVSFDADAGPDADGRPVLVYSRCRREPSNEDSLPGWLGARGCDVFRLPLEGGRERRVAAVNTRAASETTPSMWRGAIAFARAAPGQDRARIWLRRAGARRLVRLSGGTVARCDDGTRCEEGSAGGVEALDLGERGAVHLWALSGGNIVGVGFGWEVRVAPLDGRRAPIATSGYVGGACGYARPFSPNAVGTTGVYGRASLADGDCDGPEATLVASYAPRSGRRSEAGLTGGRLHAVARDGTTTYVLLGSGASSGGAVPGPGGCLAEGAACELVRAEVVLRRVRGGEARPPLS